MKILVTGHKGFIGSQLVEKLKNLNHEIHGIDHHENKDILTSEFPKVTSGLKLATFNPVGLP